VGLEYTVFDNFFDCVAVFNENAEVIYLNDSFERFCETSRGRILRVKQLEKFIRFSQLSVNPQTLQKITEATQYAEEVVTVAYKGDRRIQYYVSPLSQSRWMLSMRDVSLEEKLYAKFQVELEAKGQAIEELNRKLFENQILLQLSDELLKCPQGLAALETCLRSISKAMQFNDAAVYAFPNGRESEFICCSLSRPGSMPLPTACRSWLQKLRGPEYMGEQSQIQPLIEAGWAPKDAGGLLVWPLNMNSAVRGWAFFTSSEKRWPQWAELSRLLRGLISTLSVAIEGSFLLERSIRDGLTGLYNVTYFKSRLEDESFRAGRNNEPLAVCLFDIDYFKKVNDTHGHLVGDQVLIQVASILRSTVRKSDLVARYGGEEFVVMMPDTNMAGAVIAAEKLRQAIAESPVKINNNVVIPVTASAGLAEYSTVINPTSLLAMADQALYSAKAQGRNRVCQFGISAKAA
jgi:diguanylate cyclase (GGDEF)-like protein